MKRSIFLALFLVVTLWSFSVLAQDTDDKTNDFYDNSPTVKLPFSKTMEVSGEVGNPQMIDITTLPLRSVIVKEAVLSGTRDTFIGAYRYDGYSLFDILNQIVIKKKLEAEFSSMIDCWVEIENSKNEKVVVSMGEIYYPIHRNEIIIACSVSRIVPTKTKDLWTLPTESKLIVASDLVSERNITSPTKITVHSFQKSYPLIKEAASVYSSTIHIYKNEQIVDSITNYPKELFQQQYSTVFYGRGKGIHGINEFKGVMLKDVLKKYVTLNKENIQHKIIAVIAKDGFRCVYTFSELFNRNDYAEVLLIDKKTDKKYGAFSLFPAQDYFSDRAIKAISEIRIF